MSQSFRLDNLVPRLEPPPRIWEFGRCLDCRVALVGSETCPGCGRSYPEVDQVVQAMNPLSGRNAVAQSFYDGPGWVKFRRWERLFLKVQGGEARARRQILRHLTAPPFARVLEVGIGDGANLALMPKDWTFYGVDIAVRALNDCLVREPRMAGHLVRAEAEALPFADGSFDACFTVGGFNYFRDHEHALGEMKRVTRPGGTVVAADEIPHLHQYGVGHRIGVKAIDAFWLRMLGLDRDFVEMVFSDSFDPDTLIRKNWPGAARFSIWGGLGYCYVDSDASALAFLSDSAVQLDPTQRRNLA